MPRRSRTFFASRFLLAVFLVAAAVQAQDREKKKADPSELTLDRIFASGDLATKSPPRMTWHAGKLALWKRTKNGEQELVLQDPATGTEEVLVPAHWLIPPGESKQLAVENHAFSADGSRLLLYTNSKRVWRVNSRGDYWVLDLTNRALTKLGGDIPAATMMFATFSPDGRRVAYVHDNDLFVQDIQSGTVTRLTKRTADTQIHGTFDWVYEEELGLRNGFRWSPDNRSLAFWQIDASGVKEFLITDSSAGPYPALVRIRYPKTGEKNPAARIGVVAVSGGPITWLDLPGDPREHYLAKMDWAGDEIALQRFNRLQNANTVFLADPRTGKARPVFTETDRAWVENDNDFLWLDGGKHLLWLSERDGWRHVYRISRSGKKVERLTREPFDVVAVEAVDEKDGWLYFLASPDDPTQRYLYRVPLAGGPAVRLTPQDQPGTHAYRISPDGRWAIHTFSTFTRPPTTDLIRLPEHEVVRTFEDNEALRKKLAQLNLGSSEFFRVEIEKGVALDGWCIKPPKFDPKRKYPVVFYVYGEPAGQTVLDRWSDKRFLWHHLLARKGYLVFSVDNRGTPAPRGRDWRRSIYRQVGVLASQDQAAATRVLLRQRPYLDPERIAIWGWSGGGSMSLNAIFRHPDLYRTAMSIAPVPNQRHYDTIYQERYMGLPADNVEGYRKGSPIHFAKHLKGNLLLVHGTGDDNCHYLGMEALIDELIAHGKQFTMMAYPNRRHGINEGRNTTRHLYDLLTRYLLANNPP